MRRHAHQVTGLLVDGGEDPVGHVVVLDDDDLGVSRDRCLVDAALQRGAIAAGRGHRDDGEIHAEALGEPAADGDGSLGVGGPVQRHDHVGERRRYDRGAPFLVRRLLHPGHLRSAHGRARSATFAARSSTLRWLAILSADVQHLAVTVRLADPVSLADDAVSNTHADLHLLVSSGPSSAPGVPCG